jgi:lysophospholipase L1-like esterase
VKDDQLLAAPEHWVTSWAAAPQPTQQANLPPAPFTDGERTFVNATLRQTVRLSAGGRRLRLRLSNAFGGTPLPVTAGAVALPAGGLAGVSATQPGSSRPVTFSGRPSAVMPSGAQLVSDPLDLAVPPGANLTVTVYFDQGTLAGDVTSHLGSRTTSHLLAGDHVGREDLPGAGAVDHWYFLSGVEALAPANTSGLALLGDSLTDGRGSTTNGNDRWPDQLLDRLLANPTLVTVAVVNQAIGGNRVLLDGEGRNALACLDRDVFSQSGIRSLLVFEGVNDLGVAEATEAAQRAVTDDLIMGYDQIVTRAHALGVLVYGATLTPFGGNDGYDDAASTREYARQAVNAWIRTSGRFDAVVDFDAVVRDPANPRRIASEYDTGDHLHLNPVGYHRLAEAFPVELFTALPGERRPGNARPGGRA